MGAIIGGLYAIGWTTSELDSLVRNQDWVALLSDKLSRSDQLVAEKEINDTYLLSVPLSLKKKFSIPSGVLAGQSVLNLLNEMTLGYHDDDLDFDSLPIPFACVAYDMVKGQRWSSAAAICRLSSGQACPFPVPSCRCRWTAWRWSTAASTTTSRWMWCAKWGPMS